MTLNVLACFAALLAATTRAEPASPIASVVLDREGRPAAGILITATPAGLPMTHGSVTDSGGRFEIEIDAAGPHRVAIADPRFEKAARDSVAPGAMVRFTAVPLAADQHLHPSSAWLGRLPEGPEKRWFILDCTGCHQFNETRVFREGELRTAEQWTEDVERMLSSFGPKSGFPIISAHRTPKEIAGWITGHLNGRATSPAVPATKLGSSYTITEYDLPEPDLPHDVAVDSAGRVIVTGMFTHRMIELDPSTGGIREVAIPVPMANPRAIEVDRGGRWWVLLGQPGLVAQYDPQTSQWRTAAVNMYGHSIGVDREGRVWTNDHFASDSLRLAQVRVEADRLVAEEFRGPPVPGFARGPSPIPYDLRVAPDGRVWISLLHGGAMVAFDPQHRRFQTFELPEPDAGPRRFDIDPNGILWIPGYSASKLFRLDPVTGETETFSSAREG